MENNFMIAQVAQGNQSLPFFSGENLSGNQFWNAFAPYGLISQETGSLNGRGLSPALS